MSTAQMTSRIKLDVHREWDLGKSGPGTAERRRSGSLLSAAVSAVTGKMERGDTLSDRAAGYGLCGFTLFYLGAQVIRSVF